MNVIAFIRKVVGGAAQAALSGHTPATAHAAVDKVLRARDKAEAIEKDVTDAIHVAQSARSAVIATVAEEIRIFEQIKARL